LQVELLNYRRLEDTPLARWLSNGFSMESLLQSLEQNDIALIPLVNDGVTHGYCACGKFHDVVFSPRREQACTHYFSNLDDWHRTTFLDDEFLEEVYGYR
jgi:hypothetical protein